MRPVLLTSLAGLLALTACSLHPNPHTNPYGIWTGQLITDEGICPTNDVSALHIRGHKIVFTPGMSATVLHGHYTPGRPQYHAELRDKGMDNTPYQQFFDGTPSGNAILGTFLSPRCRAHVTLHPAVIP